METIQRLRSQAREALCLSSIVQSRKGNAEDSEPARLVCFDFSSPYTD
jgi:hypothetical protein